MSKGGAQATPAVDPNALGQAQANANIETAQQQAIINNARTSSPLGQSNWELVTPPGGGTPRWTLGETLDPSVQPVFNAQTSLMANLPNQAQGISQQFPNSQFVGAGLLDSAYNNLSQNNYQNEVTQAQNAAYNTQAGFLDPQFKEKSSDLTQQLADQGISAGSQAYDRATQDLGRESDLAYQQARDSAVAAGNQEQAQLFGENLNVGGLGQNILSSLPGQLSTLGNLGNFAWAGGLPTYGGTPTTVSPTNVIGAQQVANQAAANQFASGNTLNNQLFNGANLAVGAAGNSGLLSGLGSLLGFGGPAAATAGGIGDVAGFTAGSPGLAALLAL